jgi:hypothetical protein
MRISRHVHRLLVLGGVGALVCASTLTIASCTQVGDSLTGITLSRSAFSTCLGECRTNYNDASAVERKRHAAQVDVCRGLETQDRGICLEAENVLNQQIMAQLKAELEECQNNCHRQGGGSGN